MQKLILTTAIIVIASITSIAQLLPVDPESKLITYSEVVQIDNVSKDELYSRANEWFAKYYKSANAVLQMNNQENGKLVGKPLTTVFVTALGREYEIGHVKYTITISCKDGRYKYEITDFMHDAGAIQTGSVGPLEKEKTGMLSPNNKQWHQIKENTNEKMLALIADMKKSMSTKTEADW